MGDVWGWLLIVGQIVVPVAALGAVLYFFVRVLGLRPRGDGSAVVVVLLAATVAQWCWPFLALACWVGSRHFPRFAPHHPFCARLRLARVTHLAGLAGGAVVFVPVFRSWDTMYIFVPLGVFLLAPMHAGYAVGLLVLRRRGSRPAAPR